MLSWAELRGKLEKKSLSGKRMKTLPTNLEIVFFFCISQPNNCVEKHLLDCFVDSDHSHKIGYCEESVEYSECWCICIQLAFNVVTAAVVTFRIALPH